MVQADWAAQAVQAARVGQEARASWAISVCLAETTQGVFLGTASKAFVAIRAAMACVWPVPPRKQAPRMGRVHRSCKARIPAMIAIHNWRQRVEITRAPVMARARAKNIQSERAAALAHRASIRHKRPQRPAMAMAPAYRERQHRVCPMFAARRHASRCASMIRVVQRSIIVWGQPAPRKRRMVKCAGRRMSVKAALASHSSETSTRMDMAMPE